MLPMSEALAATNEQEIWLDVRSSNGDNPARPGIMSSRSLLLLRATPALRRLRLTAAGRECEASMAKVDAVRLHCVAHRSVSFHEAATAVGCLSSLQGMMRPPAP
jgi:hypothetical protein